MLHVQCECESTTTPHRLQERGKWIVNKLTWRYILNLENILCLCIAAMAAYYFVWSVPWDSLFSALWHSSNLLLLQSFVIDFCKKSYLAFSADILYCKDLDKNRESSSSLWYCKPTDIYFSVIVSANWRCELLAVPGARPGRIFRLGPNQPPSIKILFWMLQSVSKIFFF